MLQTFFVVNHWQEAFQPTALTQGLLLLLP
jgi:hypothetical protein